MPSLETFTRRRSGVLHHRFLYSAASQMLGDGETGDLSLKMLLMLASALGLWLVYGFMRADAMIIIANAVSLALLGGIVFFKVRGPKKPSHETKTPADRIVPARGS
jgi:uncharacterized protein with PQ loop repeat